VVKECVHIETGQRYAAKIINKRLMSGREHMVKNEIVVLKRLSEGHRNILTLVDYFETSTDLYLITDLACGGELFDRIYSKGAYYESDAIEIVTQVCLGVAYLHVHGIVHRDIKPENLLFRAPDDHSELLIADFGLSRIIDEEKLNMLMTTCGTPSYMSPEMFNKTGHGKPVDVWAIGVITYFLLCGYNPFDRDTSAEEMQAVLTGDYAFEPEEDWKDVSMDARDFINQCLKMKPEERMTAHQALQHPFLTRSLPEGETDLLPRVMSNLNLRRRKSSASSISDVDQRLQALRQLKETGCMDGAYSKTPEEVD
jgi:calcium/calmodulin-dependent protein kinase I